MIVAVDFDGILCTDCFPDIGSPDYSMISFVRQLMDQGHEVILWTSRVEDMLEEAVRWCHDYGLHFCAVNGGAPSNLSKYRTDPRKVYADIYIDDHSPRFVAMLKLGGRGYAIDDIISTVRRILT